MFLFRFPGRFAGVVLALALAACGDEGAPPGPGPAPEDPPPGGLTAADARPIADAVIPGLFLSIAAITQPTPSLAGPLSGVADAATLGGGARLSSPVSCPSFEPDPFPDADGDGVPDRTTFSFDSAACDIAVTTGTIDRRGTFLVSDPGAGPGYDLAFIGVGAIVTSTGGDANEAESSGTRRLRGNASAVRLDEAVDFQYRVNSVPTLRHRTDWGVDFTAREPGRITATTLPDGEFEVDGGLTLEDAGRRFDLLVETLEPVEYDARCASFESGTVRAYLQGREGEGEVRVTFHGCARAATITFLP